MGSNILITGAAGFIGSHLAEKLTELDHYVIGVDCFTDYYPKKIKEQNLSKLLKGKSFVFREKDLFTADLEEILSGVDIIFHEAAQAGVRASWGANFEIYTRNNIQVTQRLLEAAKEKPIKKIVFASSSSVYGDCKDLPMREDSRLSPISPYGVTKLATEHLCQLYSKNYRVPIIILRYFTVYGPRQRPDMAFHKFIRAILEGKEIPVYGDGKQTRDFTYISDAVEANLSAMDADSRGEVFNIGGGSQIALIECIRILEDLLGKKAKLKFLEIQRGDMRDTAADISKARKMLGFEPKYDLKAGLEKTFLWFMENYTSKQ